MMPRPPRRPAPCPDGTCEMPRFCAANAQGASATALCAASGLPRAAGTSPDLAFAQQEIGRLLMANSRLRERVAALTAQLAAATAPADRPVC